MTTRDPAVLEDEPEPGSLPLLELQRPSGAGPDRARLRVAPCGDHGRLRRESHRAAAGGAGGPAWPTRWTAVFTGRAAPPGGRRPRRGRTRSDPASGRPPAPARRGRRRARGGPDRAPP